jgi:hypothetical protein
LLARSADGERTRAPAGIIRTHGCSCHKLRNRQSEALHYALSCGLCHHDDLVARNLIERGGDVGMAAGSATIFIQ